MFALAVLGGLCALFVTVEIRRNVEAGRGQLEKAGLPRDLPRHVGHVRELRLPANVEDLRWLGGRLRDLEVSSLEPGVPIFFPPHLRSFRSNGAVAPGHLERIPPRVESLRLPALDLGTWPPWPAALVELEALGGGDLRDLPDTLQRLSLTGLPSGDPTRLDDLWGLPPISELELRGEGILTLEGVPLSVRSLVVRRTAVRALGELPETLQHLDLDGNQNLTPVVLAQLPRHLISLRAAARPRARISILEPPGQPGWPRYLRSLTLLRLEPPLIDPARLPSGLVSLEIDVPSLADLSNLPAHLETLHLRGGRGIDLGGLPRRLRALTLEGTVAPRLETLTAAVETLELLDVEELPSLDARAWPLRHLVVSGRRSPLVVGLPDGLESLTLQQPGSRRLPSLPAGLVELDLSGWRDLEDLGGIEALSSLKVLRIADTGVSGVERLPGELCEFDVSGTRIRSLAGLPATLKSLDLSGTFVSSLAGLPDSLRSLDITGSCVRPGLGSAPPRLERLTFAQHQLRTLAGMPRSVIRLSIEDWRAASSSECP